MYYVIEEIATIAKAKIEVATPKLQYCMNITVKWQHMAEFK